MGTFHAEWFFLIVLFQWSEKFAAHACGLLKDGLEWMLHLRLPLGFIASV